MKVFYSSNVVFNVIVSYSTHSTSEGMIKFWGVNRVAFIIIFIFWEILALDKKRNKLNTTQKNKKTFLSNVEMKATM